MENVILIVILLVWLGFAVAYIVKEKKRGVQCIGCPAAKDCLKGGGEASACGGNCSSCRGCGSKTDKSNRQ